MKSFVVLGAFVASGLAQTIQFVNTTITSPVQIGQNFSVSWTNGNGLPVSLSIKNSTWQSVVFRMFPKSSMMLVADKRIADHSVLPSTYVWTVNWIPGLVTGTYQLALKQVNGGTDNSTAFTVIVPSTNSTAQPATTITYSYWDTACGCTKTNTAIAPVNTGTTPATTSWWDHHCGCTMSAVVPVATIPAGNNYTAPAAPTAAPITNPPSVPAPTTAAPAASTFRGEAGRFEGSILGMVAIFVAMAVA